MITIRASMLPSYHDCPRRAAAKQFRSLIREYGYELRDLPRSIGVSVGNGIHAGIGSQCQSYIFNREWAEPLSNSIELSIEKYRSDIADGVMFDEATGSNNDAEKQIVQALKSFDIQMKPLIKPIEVEKTAAPIEEEEFQFTGTPDIIDENDYIDDIKGWKTASNYHAQLGGYGILKTSETGKTYKMRVWSFPRTSLKKAFLGVQMYEYDYEFCMDLAAVTIRNISEHVKLFQAIKNEWAFPCNPMSQLCTDKYCPAKGTGFCRF